MHVNSDIYGDYKECLQCGLMLELDRNGNILAPLTDGGRAEAKGKKVA